MAQSPQIIITVFYDSSDNTRLTDSADDLQEDNQLPLIKSVVSFPSPLSTINSHEMLLHHFCPSEHTVSIRLFLNRYVPVPSSALLQSYLADPTGCFLQTDCYNRYEMLCIVSLLKHPTHCLSIFEAFFEDLSIYQVTYVYMICVYYDNAPLAQRLFCLIREFLLYWKGIQNEFNNPDTDRLAKSMLHTTLRLTKDCLQIEHNEKAILLDPVLLRSCFVRDKRKRESLAKVQYKYSQYSIKRKKSLEDYEDNEHSYPHRFWIYETSNQESPSPVCFAYQESMHSHILLFSEENSAECRHCPEYIGEVTRNYWGTQFRLFSHGVSAQWLSALPANLVEERQELLEIAYHTNILGEAPRAFSLGFQHDSSRMTLHSVKPEYNQEKDVFQLNFYGRAHQASARNFQIVEPSSPDDILLMHCKDGKNSFNLDFRHPLSPLQAIATALTSISKKFLVC